ncbi:hypothetical protein MCP1_290030 [Candidatus Terasakiella magnetica]|nr:hypothetical protein MCP1_290030 [Candidatus Terasakiella magnetica]
MDFWQIASATAAISTLACGSLLLPMRGKLAAATTRLHETQQMLEEALEKHHQSEQNLAVAHQQLSLIADIEHYLERHAERTAELQALSRGIEAERSALGDLLARNEELSGTRDGIVAEIEGMRQRLADLSEQVTNTELELSRMSASAANERLSIERHRLAVAIALKADSDASVQIRRENESKVDDLLEQQASLRNWYAEKKAIYDDLCFEVDKLTDRLDFAEMGHFDFDLTYDSSATYAKAMAELKEWQKAMISAGQAVLCSTTWTINGSLTEGKANTKRQIRLTLRAFNNECDVCVSRVTWRNYTRMHEQITQAYATINKVNVGNCISITSDYLNLKLQELKLSYEEKLKKREEAELLREERAREREEMRAQKELEAAAKKAAEEEVRQIRALAKARAELEAATAAEREQLEKRIQELEKRIAVAGDLKERAISMAQQTRIGHVYVISNVGAFGQGVFKIGMTRRLEPVERIHELGGASVPFPFDIHAMVFTQDAPSLERALHSQLDPYRINRVNNRKEFFRASLAVVKEAMQVHAPDATFVNEPDAQQYFASLPSEVIERMRVADEEENEDEVDMFPAELV